jgi:hypothetical protein
MITQHSQTNEAKNANICIKKKKHFHWTDALDFILINLLETYSSALLKYIVQLLNSSCNINVTRIQMHNHIQYM